MITEVGWDGSIRRSVLETVGLPDAGHWEYLIEQILAVPPRYQATPGSPVYVIHAGARAVLVGAQNLAGPLYELVSIIQQRGRPALAAKQLYPFGHPHVGNRETPASLSGYERQELGGHGDSAVSTLDDVGAQRKGEGRPAFCRTAADGKDRL